MVLPVLVTIAVGFLGFAIYLDRTEQANRIADIDNELTRAERSGSPRLGPVNPGGGAPGGGVVEEGDVDGAEVDVTAPVQLLVESDGTIVSSIGAPSPFGDASLERLAGLSAFNDRTIATDDDSNHRVLVVLSPDERVQVTALSLETFDAAVVNFRRALVLGGLVIAALVGIVVWFVTTLVTRPVTRLSTTASIIAAGELDASVKGATGSREVLELAANFDSMVARLRSALAASEENAAQAVAARDDMRRFLADVSHELRTPLTALKGYSDLYAVGALETPDDVARAMSRIGSESERLTSLTTEMLALMRETPAEELAAEFDLSTVATEVVDDVRAARPEQRIETEFVAGLRAVGSPGRVHQVILNLLSNACEHGQSAHGIRVHTRRIGSEIELMVIDRGPGVAEADAHRIFLPLYRAESSRARMGASGAGLGLALSKQIAEEHAGSLEAMPTKGGGATFILRLPSMRRARFDPASLDEDAVDGDVVDGGGPDHGLADHGLPS